MAKLTLKQTNWYVIQVLTGNELAICDTLKKILDKDLYEQCFVPMCEMPYKKKGKYINIKKPLFPGYLFIVSDFIDDVHSTLWKVAKFKRILRTDNTFVPMEEEEVEIFKGLVDETFNISLSIGFIEGDKVEVTDGPLKGQEGLIKKIDRHKRMAIVEMPFLGKATRVRMPLEIVEKR